MNRRKDAQQRSLPEKCKLRSEQRPHRYTYICGGCSVAKPRPALTDNLGCSTPGFPVLHCLLSFLRFVSIESVMPSTRENGSNFYLNVKPHTTSWRECSRSESLTHCWWECKTERLRSVLLHTHPQTAQDFCLENPMDGVAWKAAVHKVAEGQTRLSDFTFTFRSVLLNTHPQTAQDFCLENPMDGVAW